jgi:hypothetical protein
MSIHYAVRAEFNRANAEEKRRIITQLRRQKHGALHDVKSNEQWTAQCSAIAAELGIDWAKLNGAAKPAAEEAA